MPSHYTHKHFGKLIQQALPTPLRRVTETAPDAYFLGVHGPDFLFYYRPISHSVPSQEGFSIHKRSGLTFMENATLILRDKPSVTQVSYMIGFITHYMLDSACHPYVDILVASGQASHTAIETDLDRYLLLQDGHDPLRYDSTSHIIPSQKLARSVAPFYPGITPKICLEAMQSMKRITRLFRLHPPALQSILFPIFRSLGIYESYGGMFMTSIPNPRCADSTPELVGRMNHAQSETLQEIYQYFMGLPDGVALSQRFTNNFSGHPAQTDA